MKSLYGPTALLPGDMVTTTFDGLIITPNPGHPHDRIMNVLFKDFPALVICICTIEYPDVNVMSTHECLLLVGGQLGYTYSAHLTRVEQ